MHIYEIILIGLALSMDACALTISNCATYKGQLNKYKEWSMPIAFAIFQGIMPLIGYFIGSLFADFLITFSKFLTAGIFFVLAFKIVFDIIKEKLDERKLTEVSKNTEKTTFTIAVLLIQALATSIDALAIGITFIDLAFSVAIAVLIISAVTFILVTLALYFGKYLGKLFGSFAEWLGAIILIILAVKSLVEALI